MTKKHTSKKRSRVEDSSTHTYCAYCDIYFHCSLNEHNFTLEHLLNVDAYQIHVLGPTMRGAFEKGHNKHMDDSIQIMNISTDQKTSEEFPSIQHLELDTVSRTDRMECLEVAADIRQSHLLSLSNVRYFRDTQTAVAAVRKEHASAVVREAHLRGISADLLPKIDKFGNMIPWEDVAFCQPVSELPDKGAVPELSSSWLTHIEDIRDTERRLRSTRDPQLRTEKGQTKHQALFPAPWHNTVSQLHSPPPPPLYSEIKPPITVAGVAVQSFRPLPSNPKIKIGIAKSDSKSLENNK